MARRKFLRSLHKLLTILSCVFRCARARAINCRWRITHLAVYVLIITQSLVDLGRQFHSLWNGVVATFRMNMCPGVPFVSTHTCKPAWERESSLSRLSHRSAALSRSRARHGSSPRARKCRRTFHSLCSARTEPEAAQPPSHETSQLIPVRRIIPLLYPQDTPMRMRSKSPSPA